MTTEAVLSVGIPVALVSKWTNSGGDVELALELQQEILGYVGAAYEEWRDALNHEYDD